jgi:hypothetical protein
MARNQQNANMNNHQSPAIKSHPSDTSFSTPTSINPNDSFQTANSNNNSSSNLNQVLTGNFNQQQQLPIKAQPQQLSQHHHQQQNPPIQSISHQNQHTSTTHHAISNDIIHVSGNVNSPSRPQYANIQPAK